jgi:hypothetical protein
MAVIDPLNLFPLARIEDEGTGLSFCQRCESRGHGQIDSTYGMTNCMPTCDKFYLAAKLPFLSTITTIKISTIPVRPISCGRWHYLGQLVAGIIEDILL